MIKDTKIRKSSNSAVAAIPAEAKEDFGIKQVKRLATFFQITVQ